jgi:hypothetical protein
MKHYSPTGRRNHGRLLKRLLDTWDRNGTSGPTPWQIHDDDDKLRAVEYFLPSWPNGLRPYRFPQLWPYSECDVHNMHPIYLGSIQYFPL